MKTKSSKKRVPATVFALIIVLSAFAVMCTTVSANGLVKTLDSDTGDLGDVVHVTISGEVGAGQTVTVVDTLPSELSYITGTFTVDSASAIPTVTKQEISYTIDNTAGAMTKPYTIGFDVKVTEASWEEVTVTNVVVAGDERSAVDFTINAFEDLWKEADGPLTIYEKTETQWPLVISVTNPFDYTMENTVITDRFGAEIKLDEIVSYDGEEPDIDYGPGKKKPNKSKKLFLTWNIGDLEPGDTATLNLLVSTDLNPAGHQEYTTPTEPGEYYEMNSGATLKFKDLDQDQLSAVTDSIYVTVLEED